MTKVERFRERAENPNTDWATAEWLEEAASTIAALEAQLAQRDERIAAVCKAFNEWRETPEIAISDELLERLADLADVREGTPIICRAADRLLAVPDAKEGEGK